VASADVVGGIKMGMPKGSPRVEILADLHKASTQFRRMVMVAVRRPAFTGGGMLTGRLSDPIGRIAVILKR
jgi:hypothetical protein